MIALSAAVTVLALLLVHAGVVKLWRPEAVGAALTDAGLPSSPPAPQFIGLTEIVVGGAALVTGHAAAFTVLGATYAAFALFSVRQRRRGAGCGCFGEPTAEVSRTHIGLDVVGAFAAFAAAAAAAPAPFALVSEGPLVAVLVVLLAATAVAALQLLVAALPDLAAAVAEGETRP